MGVVSNDLCLMTPTWSGDKVHFSLMRASIERSALRTVPHYVVVQTEDVEYFRDYASDHVKIFTTADVLPGNVEAMRQRARRFSARLGRNWTRIAGSVARHTGWPRWVNYTGWHVQQITKLAVTAAAESANVVAMDSDVVVTRHARVEDFLHPSKIVCFQHWTPPDEVIEKVSNWNRQAHALFEQPYSADAPVDTYFDTPFVLHTETVRNMLAYLESRKRRPWWEVLLGQPPRKWSEFGTYRTYLRTRLPEQDVDWRSDTVIRYLFDASDPQAVRDEVQRLLADSGSHYITIHSQSSGRQLWGAEEYAPLVLPLLADQ